MTMSQKISSICESNKGVSKMNWVLLAKWKQSIFEAVNKNITKMLTCYYPNFQKDSI